MSLYLEHFGLREPPFRITPHTDFFFTGANRGPTLDALIYAITRDEGIVAVTGEVGSGKTMLCRMLLERLPDDVESLYLANPSLSREEILGAIADELGIPVSGKTTHSMIRALQDALVARYAAGKRVVLLIDEAHAMPAESLEEIRLLSNLESKATKLLQIALFAQPELDARLAENDMRQLRERITQHFSLAPLQGEEVTNYIEFRLRTAGYRGPNPFTAKAIDIIADVSEGLSRRINIVADKALLAAYSSGTHQVDVKEVKTAAQDARFVPIARKPALGLPRLATGQWVALGALLIAALAALFVLMRPAPLPQEAPITSSPAPASASLPDPHAGLPALVAQHARQYDQWLPAAQRENYFIQITSRDAAHVDDIETFLNKGTPGLDPALVRVYVSNSPENPKISVIYGDFPSKAVAQAAIRNLPDTVRRMRPYARQVSTLQ